MKTIPEVSATKVFTQTPVIDVDVAADVLKITTESYTLSYEASRPYVHLGNKTGGLMELFIFSSVHTKGQDDTVRVLASQVIEADGEVILSFDAESSVWDKKTYRFRCQPRRLIYEIEVEGQGSLSEVQYFGGYYSAKPRWGSGFFWSGQTFIQGFNPEPTVEEVYYFNPSAGSMIDLSGVPVVGKDGWFFTPPPFCFAFQGQDRWVGVGVEARAGENRYTDFHYRAQRSGFYLTLSYEGYTRVKDRYQLPAIGFDFADTAYGALERHVQALRQQHYVPTVAPKEAPAWWIKPMFCGWGSQCHLAVESGGRAPDYARQEHYQQFLGVLKEHGVAPGTIVLDDKWQLTYGGNEIDPEKWPDFKGFIREQHEAGRKVLLWLKAWDPEGVPPEECVRNAAGLPLAVDPTHPAFEARFRASIRTLLSAGGYDADGFKLDFTARIPNGPGLRKRGDAWGLELLRRYLEILYSEAKLSKPDALVMTHTPHPYLADVLDMIRLNDINKDKHVERAMRHRARIASLACPAAIIDTDNWPIADKATWSSYLRLQPELGVPSLYYASHIDTTGEALEAEDYALIREVWARYQQDSGTPDTDRKPYPC